MWTARINGVQRRNLLPLVIPDSSATAAAQADKSPTRVESLGHFNTTAHFGPTPKIKTFKPTRFTHRVFSV